MQLTYCKIHLELNCAKDYLMPNVDVHFQGGKKLFVLAFDNTSNNDNTDSANQAAINSHRKYFCQDYK